MKMQALLTAVVTMVLMSAGAASADTITGNYTVSATGSGSYTGNKPGLSDDLPATFSQAVSGYHGNYEFLHCGANWLVWRYMEYLWRHQHRHGADNGDVH